MKPYPLKGKGKAYHIANYRISRGRRVVENTFGILASRFRVLGSTILVRPERVRVIVYKDPGCVKVTITSTLNPMQYVTFLTTFYGL